MKQMAEVLETDTFNPRRSYTPEQLAEARAKMQKRLAEEMGMCRHDCPECLGLGWISNGAGKLEMCPNVDRWKTKAAPLYGITRNEADNLRWSGILSGTGLDQAAEAVRRVIEWGFGWVYLYGDYGSGKSLVLKTAVAEALARNRDAAYVRMAEILDHLRAGFDPNSGQSESSRLDWWSDIQVLCIDEFDRVRGTEYVDERRFVLMDRRYEQACRRETVTVMASNGDPASLPGYLYDRVRDGRFFVVKVTGNSMRPAMHWEDAT